MWEPGGRDIKVRQNSSGFHRQPIRGYTYLPPAHLNACTWYYYHNLSSAWSQPLPQSLYPATSVSHKYRSKQRAEHPAAAALSSAPEPCHLVIISHSPAPGGLRKELATL